MAITASSDEFAAMVRTVLAQLDISEHPWRIVPPLVPAVEENIGVHVEGVATVYIPAEVSSTVDEFAARLADQLQDHVIDMRLHAVPACLPGHPHPPNDTLVDGRAMWTCPRTGEAFRSIMADHPT